MGVNFEKMQVYDFSNLDLHENSTDNCFGCDSGDSGGCDSCDSCDSDW